MSFLRSVSRASKGATCAITMALLAMSSADAQTTTIVDDSFADGITSLAADQIGFNTTSSTLGLNVDQAPGPVDFASGNSSRSIHGLFPIQTLTNFGDVLTVTFDFTTPDTISYDGGQNDVQGDGAVTTNEDFKFGLFDTTGTAGVVIDSATGLPADFTGPIDANTDNPNDALRTLAGFQGEVDNINASGTDLGIRTHNVNSNLAHGFPTGRLFSTNTGFDFVAGGDDDIVSFAPNSDYVATMSLTFTDETLTAVDITVGMEAVDGTYVDSFTRSVFIADTDIVTVDPETGVESTNTQAGLSTTSFDLLAIGTTSGAFGGTDGPVVGSSTVGEANNGIDISNVTVTFTEASDVLKGDVDLSGEVDLFDISPFIAVLTTPGSFQAEADVDCNGEVNLFDIAPFIAILTGQPAP